MGKTTGQYMREKEQQIHAALVGCSTHAKLCWLEARYVIEVHSERKGYVMLSGRPISPRQLAHAAGCPGDGTPGNHESHAAVTELIDAGILQTDESTLYAPHILDVCHYRGRNAARQRDHKAKVLGNADEVLPSAQGNAKVTPRPPPPALPLSPTPPISIPPTSPRISTRGRDVKPLPEIPEALRTPEFIEAWTAFVADRKARRKTVTAIAAGRIFKDAVEWGPAVATQALWDNVKNGWTGVFKPKGTNGTASPSNRARGYTRPGEYPEPAPEIPRFGAANPSRAS